LFCQFDGYERYDYAEKFVVKEDIFHKDPKVLDDLHCGSEIVDTFDIISNVSIVSNFHKDHVISFEISEDKCNTLTLLIFDFV